MFKTPPPRPGLEARMDDMPQVVQGLGSLPSTLPVLVHLIVTVTSMKPITVILPVFKVGTLRQSEVKELTLYHPTGKWQSQALNPRQPGVLFPALPLASQ